MDMDMAVSVWIGMRLMDRDEVVSVWIGMRLCQYGYG